MSSVAASSAINHSKLESAADLTSKEVCNHNSEMQSLDTDLKTLGEEIMSREGLSINSLKPFTTYALHSNKMIVNTIFPFKKDKVEGKGPSKKMERENKEIFDVLGDEYMKMSTHTLDFLSEMENLLMFARNSHSYFAPVIQQYLEMETDKRDANHYRLVLEKLEKVKGSDSNIYELSAKSFLQKAEGLQSQHEEMAQKLNVEIDKLAKKEKSARYWENIPFMGAVFGLIRAIAIQFKPVPHAAAPIATAGHKSTREANVSSSDETRVAIRELGHIKSSIDDVIKLIRSLLNKPNPGKDQEDIHFCMNKIKGNLSEFLNNIDDLDKDLKKLKKEIREGRERVLVMQKN